MEALYHQTNCILKDIEMSFQRLPPNNALSVDSSKSENAIQTQITQVNANCERLDILLYKITPSQRQTARMQIDQLKYDARHLQNSLQMYREKRKRYQYELEQREQLLSHRFTANSQDTCIDLDSLQSNYTRRMSNAHRGLDEMLVTGNNIMDSLLHQRSTLSGAHRRLLNIGSTLGLSNHTMKMIERRLVENKYIMYGGMIVTMSVIIVVVYFFVL